MVLIPSLYDWLRGNGHTFNPFNRLRHEISIHEKNGIPSRQTVPSSSVRFSPRVTRQKKSQTNGRKKPILDFENDPVARQLRDKTMREINAKFAERNKRANEDRRRKAEERKRILEEKNRLAEENERRREEEEKEKRARSERAIANLVASRKRRRWCNFFVNVQPLE